MLLLALLLHFGLILIYANPIPVTKTKWQYYAEWYAYPYFTQNWKLFAPVPNTNYRLFVEYEDKGIQKTDLFQEILLNHQRNRLKGYGPVLLSFSNSLHYFEKSTASQKKLNGPIRNDPYFEIVEKSALNYIRSTRKINIEKAEVILLVEHTDTSFTRAYYN